MSVYCCYYFCIIDNDNDVIVVSDCCNCTSLREIPVTAYYV